jgi:hypothetical protein
MATSICSYAIHHISEYTLKRTIDAFSYGYGSLIGTQSNIALTYERCACRFVGYLFWISIVDIRYEVTIRLPPWT